MLVLPLAGLTVSLVIAAVSWKRSRSPRRRTATRRPQAALSGAYGVA